MTFKDFIENTQNIQFLRWSSDGIVSVNINGNRYEYQADPVYFGNWQRLAKYKPFAVLNQIKQQVNKGYAKQTFPAPVQVQKNLF
jgi:hypothetical protein